MVPFAAVAGSMLDLACKALSCMCIVANQRCSSCAGLLAAVAAFSLHAAVFLLLHIQ